MNCPLCGDVCHCFLDPDTTATPRWNSDAASDSVSAALPVSLSDAGNPGTLAESAPTQTPESATDIVEPALAPSNAPEDDAAWREELAARLTHYRSRRKVRPPRYPSLRLPFENLMQSGSTSSSAPPVDPFSTVSNQALAQDWPDAASDSALAVPSQPPTSPAPSRVSGPTATPATAKIIFFPRSAEMAPPLPFDELAEPVMDRPRILDIPEITPPAPALGGITMEAPQQDEVEKRLGIEVPLQTAPLARRVAATAIDSLIVALASALFGFIFWKIAAVRPPRFQLLGLAAAVPGLFWAGYQYLLIVHSGSTPGLRLAALEILHFDDASPNRRLRRWRVLASYLSAVSLGMGYAWAFLDEDSLCWHDRITHTYLAPRKQPKPVELASGPNLSS